MVINRLLKGEHSFRGVGFVEINGLLYPICGSRRFNLSEGDAVRYRVEQLQMVRPEEQREAVVRVRINFVSGPDIFQIYYRGSNGNPTKMVDDGLVQDGIPSVLANREGEDKLQMTAPFRIRFYDRVINTSGLVSGSGSISQFIDDPVTPIYNNLLSYGNIDTELFLIK